MGQSSCKRASSTERFSVASLVPMYPEIWGKVTAGMLPNRHRYNNQMCLNQVDDIIGFIDDELEKLFPHRKVL